MASSFPNTTQWAQALLAQGTKQGMFPKGVATNASDVSAIAGWEVAEGTYGKYANPLDTTLKEPGSTNQVYTGTPGVYVQGYQSVAQGLEASLSTLKGYPSIVADINSGAPAQTTADTISGSSWGTEAFNPAPVTPAAGSNSSFLSGLGQFVSGGEAAITQPGAGLSTIYDAITGSGGSSGSSLTSGSGLLAKVGAYLIGAALLVVGLIILFKGNTPAPSVSSGGGAEEAEEVAAA